MIGMGIRVGAGVGPVRVSAGVSNRQAGSGLVYFVGAVFALAALYYVAAWPYLLGTYIAVRVFGAGQASTTRNVVGWVFEAPWALLLSAILIMALIDKVQKEWSGH